MHSSYTLTLHIIIDKEKIIASLLAKELDISAPTARSALNHLVQLNILKEISHKKRDKIYCYQTYLEILEEGAKPL